MNDFSVSLRQKQQKFRVSLISQNTKGLDNLGMNSIREIRLANLKFLIEKNDGPSRFAEKADTAASYVSQILSPTHPANVGENLARKIEKNLGLPAGWMDVPHGEASAQGNSSGAALEEAFITASSPEDLARKLKEKGNESVLEIIRLLVSSDNKLN